MASKTTSTKKENKNQFETLTSQKVDEFKAWFSQQKGPLKSETLKTQLFAKKSVVGVTLDSLHDFLNKNDIVHTYANKKIYGPIPEEQEEQKSATVSNKTSYELFDIRSPQIIESIIPSSVRGIGDLIQIDSDTFSKMIVDNEAQWKELFESKTITIEQIQSRIKKGMFFSFKKTVPGQKKKSETVLMYDNGRVKQVCDFLFGQPNIKTDNIKYLLQMTGIKVEAEIEAYIYNELVQQGYVKDNDSYILTSDRQLELLASKKKRADDKANKSKSKSENTDVDPQFIPDNQVDEESKSQHQTQQLIQQEVEEDQVEEQVQEQVQEPVVQTKKGSSKPATIVQEKKPQTVTQNTKEGLGKVTTNVTKGATSNASNANKPVPVPATKASKLKSKEADLDVQSNSD